MKSDIAAHHIAKSCREKFPKNEQKGSVLSSSAVANISGRGRVTSGGYFSGNIYNGNKDLFITRITVRLTPKGSEGQARDYNERVIAPPLTSVDIFFKVVAPTNAEHSLKTLEATGYD